ncbi:MAG: heme transporter HemC, partial [Mesorhizobium sp.]|nr:heme transporter HemC [Mesorhizobium sp.]
MSDTTSRLAGWTDLANPTRFVGLADKVIPWLAGIATILLLVGLYMSFTAPEDFQQGITVRIMYIHVPFAWLAMMCYT